MTFTSKNKYGISHKQWLFAENYLQHFNADRAYSEVYTSSQTRNAWIILKSRPLINYIRMRLEEKQATLTRNWELANRKLQEIMESGTPQEVLQATKIVSENTMRQKELESKLKQLEKELEKPKSSNQPIVINVNEIRKEVP